MEGTILAKRIKRIGVLTGGGDCPGLNAVIRAVAKTAIIEHDIKVFGFEDGFQGLVENRYHELGFIAVSGILTQGGTILGSNNRANPFNYAVTDKNGNTVFKNLAKKCVSNFKKMKLDCLVCIGGDGTFAVAGRFSKLGLPMVCVPKTIDNDVRGTDVTVGFDSALNVATMAIDMLHSTAMSHHRAMVVEIMGRYAGWLALESGIASGGDIILIPEIPYSFDVIKRCVKSRAGEGRRFSIVVVAEGAKPKGGKMVVDRIIENSPEKVRLGGIASVLAKQIEDSCGVDARATILGHLQRGGCPTPRDRLLATVMGNHAIGLVTAGKFGNVVVSHNGKITSLPLNKVAGKPRNVPRNHPLIKAARGIGTVFGD